LACQKSSESTIDNFKIGKLKGNFDLKSPDDETNRC
jgi:hypothetical protein